MGVRRVIAGAAAILATVVMALGGASADRYAHEAEWEALAAQYQPIADEYAPGVRVHVEPLRPGRAGEFREREPWSVWLDVHGAREHPEWARWVTFHEVAHHYQYAAYGGLGAWLDWSDQEAPTNLGGVTPAHERLADCVAQLLYPGEPPRGSYTPDGCWPDEVKAAEQVIEAYRAGATVEETPDWLVALLPVRDPADVQLPFMVDEYPAESARLQEIMDEYAPAVRVVVQDFGDLPDGHRVRVPAHYAPHWVTMRAGLVDEPAEVVDEAVRHAAAVHIGKVTGRTLPSSNSGGFPSSFICLAEYLRGVDLHGCDAPVWGGLAKVALEEYRAMEATWCALEVVDAHDGRVRRELEHLAYEAGVRADVDVLLQAVAHDPECIGEWESGMDALLQ